MVVTQSRKDVLDGLTAAQLEHLARVELRSRRSSEEMAPYLAAGAEVVVYRHNEVPDVPPFAIAVAGTAFWIDCCDTEEEAVTLARSLGLKVNQ